MDAFPDGLLSMDISGCIIQANRGFNELLGYNSVNLVGKPLFNLAPSHVKKEIEKLFRELEAGERPRYRKIQLYDVKGRLRNLKVSLSLLRNDEKKPVGVMAAISDAEEEAMLEKELKELRDFSSSVLDAAGVGIIVTDLEGRIVFSSREAAKIFGMSLDLKGRNILKDSPNTLLLNERFASLIKTGASFEFEWSVKGDGGARDFISVFTLRRGRDGSPTGAVAVFKDVTRIKSIEAELKEVNAVLKEHARNLESIVETARALNSSLDREKIYRIMAEAMVRMFDAAGVCFFKHNNKRLVLDSMEGFKAGPVEAVDGKLRKFYPSLLKLKAPKIVADLSSEKSFSKMAGLLNKSLMSAVLLPVYTKDKLSGIIGVFWGAKREFKRADVEMLQSIGNSGAIAIENANLYNELKDFAANLEEKVRERTAELEQSNKLKDLFIDIMRHDLLAPAGLARLRTELLIEQEEEPIKKKALEDIQQSHVRIINMIENASVLAKLESGEKLEFAESDLGDVLRSAAEDIKSLAMKKRMEIKVEAEGHFPAMANLLIYNVFSNLLRNAVKYAPEGSQVNASITDCGSSWRVSVADRGSGIPDEHKEAIFERFKRLEKGAVEGTGLGLAIVKKVVNAHRGKVWVEDNPGGGSIFIIEIPKS